MLLVNGEEIFYLKIRCMYYVYPISQIKEMSLHRGVCIEGRKVRNFRETHKIWKNLPHGFDKSAYLLSKRQNHEEDFFKLCVLLRKSEL